MPVASDRRSDLAREPESAALGRFLRIVGGAPVSSEQVVAQDQPRQRGGVVEARLKMNYAPMKLKDGHSKTAALWSLPHVREKAMGASDFGTDKKRLRLSMNHCDDLPDAFDRCNEER
jgi:hypothetical protein